MLIVAQIAMTMKRVATAAGRSVDIEGLSWTWKMFAMNQYEIIAPSMKTSPCAKLISSRIP